MAFGIYFHWPYCSKICPYCDFNVYRPRAVDEETWVTALLADINWYAERTHGRKLTSLYFGGGTPSLMSPSLLSTLIDACHKSWAIADDIEVTLEANPTDAEQSHFQQFRDAGVNRLSLGIQSIDDGALNFLGRNHSAMEARAGLELANKIFPRTTLDLIYARPDQSLQSWEQELSTAIDTGTSHLSLYQLTVEPDTAFQKAVDRKEWALPPDPQQADFYQLTQNLCEARGLPAYEISNHACPGDESRHNFLYWQYQDYIGIGPGAHGRLTIDGQKFETQTTLQPKEYLRQSPLQRCQFTSLTSEDQASEYLLMSLRLREGMSLEHYETLTNTPLPAANLAQLSQDGLVEQNNGQLRLTKAGRPLLNRIALELLS